MLRALEDADDAPLDASALLDPLDAHDDAVAVHRLVQVRTGDVDVAAGVERPFRHDEPVAAGVRLETADVQIHLLGQAEALSADLDEVARRHQRSDVPLERRAFFARHLEQLEEFADAGRVMHPFAHRREDLF